jgi:hypothetical protein
MPWPAPRASRCWCRPRGFAWAANAAASCGTTKSGRTTWRCHRSRSMRSRSPGPSSSSSSKTAAMTTSAGGRPRRGNGCSTSSAARRATWSKCAGASRSSASAAWCTPVPRKARCTSVGTRPMPGAAGPGGACPPKSSGSCAPARWRRAVSAMATCGNGRRAPSTRIRVSPPIRGASIRSRASAPASRCAAARGPRASASASAYARIRSAA